MPFQGGRRKGISVKGQALRASASVSSRVFGRRGVAPGASSFVVYVLGWYLLRLRWVPCWPALAALVAGGVV